MSTPVALYYAKPVLAPGLCHPPPPVLTSNLSCSLMSSPSIHTSNDGSTIGSSGFRPGFPAISSSPRTRKQNKSKSNKSSESYIKEFT